MESQISLAQRIADRDRTQKHERNRRPTRQEKFDKMMGKEAYVR